MPTDSLTLNIEAGSIQKYTSLLQSGIPYQIQSGTTITEFLHSLPGFDDDYINQQIQTIFLNGNPVDSLDTAFTESKMVLALSAAMPGLAGAIFRKNSLHASLRTRSTISQPKLECESISLTMKLFNSIAIERGPDLLRIGCLVSTESLMKFFNYRSNLLKSTIQVLLNKKALSPKQLSQVLLQNNYLRLIITDKDENNT